MKCTFFGHSDISNKYEDVLRKQIIELIEKHNINTFYVGNHGNFDFMAEKILKEITKISSNINYYIVLAYLPTKKRENDYRDYSHTVYPAGLEDVPPKFAICKRNEWMINNSDFVISYITHTYGGAWTYVEKAKKKGKRIIYINDI